MQVGFAPVVTVSTAILYRENFADADRWHHSVSPLAEPAFWLQGTSKTLAFPTHANSIEKLLVQNR